MKRALLILCLLAACADKPPPPVAELGEITEVEKERVLTLSKWAWVCKMDNGSIKTGINMTIVKVGWRVGILRGKIVEIIRE